MCFRQHSKTKWVWTDRFSSGIWKRECFRTVECQQVESSRWTEQQQRKRDGVQCVCEERPAVEHRMTAEPYFSLDCNMGGICVTKACQSTSGISEIHFVSLTSMYVSIHLLIHLSSYLRHHHHSQHPFLLHSFTPGSKPTFSTNPSHLLVDFW